MRTRPQMMRAGALALLFGFLAIGVLALLLALTGFEVGRALAAAWRGAFGSTDAVLSASLVRATPLLLAGLAVTVAFRTGVLNIGADGQLLAGASAATFVALRSLAGLGAAWPVTALLASAAAGAGWALLPAILKRRFGALEVISTIMLNFVAVQLVSFLVRGPLQEPSRIYPQSAAIAEAARLPVLIAGSRLHAGFPLAVGLALVTALIFSRTAVGFRARVVGTSPSAAASAGLISVGRVQFGAFLLSGVLAGLAGGVEVLGVTYALYENLSPGYGYTAIAVALIANLRSGLVPLSACALGALAAGATAMQRDAGVPAGTAAVIEAVLVLGVLSWHAFAVAPGKWRRTAASRLLAPPSSDHS